MTISSSTETAYTELRTLADSEREVSSELGKEDFLNILVMQMANQNPLEPTSDTDFIAQLAQFSMLEQMSNLTTSFDTSSAYSMVGKNVIISTETEDSTDSEVITGKVDGVYTQDGLHYVLVDGEQYPVTDVIGVLDSDITDSTDDSSTEA